MTGTTQPDPWTPRVGDLIEDRRTGSRAEILLMVERAPSPTAAAHHVAHWDHLAATLPTVTAEETR